MSSQGSRLNKSQQRVPNDESLDVVQRHMRFVANQQRRAAPPRCHPTSICIIVHAIGCLFVGMTMVITANWPGTGSRSSNILKICGPILLGVGAILLLVGILMARFLRKKEAKSWDKKISQHILSASKQVLDQSIPTYQGQSKVRGPGTESERLALLESPEQLEIRLKKKADDYAPSDSEAYSLSSAFPQSPMNGEDVPEAVRIKKTKKKAAGSSSSFENLESLREDEGKELLEEVSGATRTTKKTIKTTTVVTKRVVEGDEGRMKSKRPKPPPVPQKPGAVPDSPRLRVKVLASPGTSVNIRHSGTSFDDDTPQFKSQSEVASKPKSRGKPKAREPRNDHGTNI